MKNDQLTKPITGFTLIELMIAIAIIGIIAGIAIPSYTTYISSTKMLLVKNNSLTAIRFLNTSFANESVRQTSGIVASPNDLPVTEVALINYLNTQLKAKAPNGSVGFASTVDNTIGIVGVKLNMSGANWVAGDNVIISSPAYINMVAYSSSVTY